MAITSFLVGEEETPMGARFRTPRVLRRNEEALAVARLMVAGARLLNEPEELPGTVCYDLAEEYLARLDACYQRLSKEHAHLRRRLALTHRLVVGGLPMSMLSLGLALGGLLLAVPLEWCIGAASLAVVLALLLLRFHQRSQRELEEHLQRLHELYAAYLECFRAYEVADVQQRGEALASLFEHWVGPPQPPLSCE
ncbi:hypothetical protein [Thermogemmatispora carboxidivorans]|uniref:hypothetical protein n=1 Tax=Thermogemmatispora carboxidivorans TaxID=1382306 RepID=UPI00069AC2C1|nr:hypothetical protein [Thermogemmatispora carboxidivorans]